MTAGKAGFGLLGAGLMASAGNEIVKSNAIDDPADLISEQICAVLNEKYQTKRSAVVLTLEDKDLALICAMNPKADLILDVRTLAWSFSYFPTNWNHYKVGYGVQIRLIDVKTQSILAEGAFGHHGEETPDAPTKDELLANNAARLKQELQKYATLCIEDFKKKIF